MIMNLVGYEKSVIKFGLLIKLTHLKSVSGVQIVERERKILSERKSGKKRGETGEEEEGTPVKLILKRPSGKET